MAMYVFIVLFVFIGITTTTLTVTFLDADSVSLPLTFLVISIFTYFCLIYVSVVGVTNNMSFLNVRLKDCIKYSLNKDEYTVCDYCGNVVSADSYYCVYCGKPLEFTCENCGEIVTYSYNYCWNCGYEIDKS